MVFNNQCDEEGLICFIGRMFPVHFMSPVCCVFR
jgi:hypothetical protein